jgi:hypothetical protein
MKVTCSPVVGHQRTIATPEKILTALYYLNEKALLN